METKRFQCSWGKGGSRLTKGHEGTFWGEGNILFPDYGGYKTMCDLSNSEIFTQNKSVFYCGYIIPDTDNFRKPSSFPC